ncbi:hypothetical protein GIB67_020789 [Kingdonia uniflora]|uniref:Uncharacterized protein n=1 Tax=Kingdonia uniflora TaxID=39325 RepID=A0A7J7M766_9MAGN|nr:hypothetical protein GIB67_020789 [Kingdonia uniflora]
MGKNSQTEDGGTKMGAPKRKGKTLKRDLKTSAKVKKDKVDVKSRKHKKKKLEGKLGSGNKLANAKWVANEVDDLTICMERIVGSYDMGYNVLPELNVQILLRNPNSISSTSTNDGYFLKGKYGGVVVSILSLDRNNGLFPIRMQKGLVDAMASVYPHANHKFFFGHMFKNMKKYHKGSHLEMVAWGVTKVCRQIETQCFLDKLQEDDPAAKEWLNRKSYNSWCTSHFDFTSKCEHITDYFSESFNWWIMRIRDKPMDKAIERLNLILIKLMYERKKKKETAWDRNGLVPRVLTHRGIEEALWGLPL